VSNWLDRPGYVALVAFIAGGIVVGLVLFFVLRGDGDDSSLVLATATPEATPEATTTTEQMTVTPAVTGTATPPRFQDPDEALNAFVLAEFDAEHIGDCPQELAPDEELPRGICSAELYRSAELVTFNLGPPFSEFFAEAVLTLGADGFWSVDIVRAPQLGEPDISIGSEVVVYLAGDCLNFREAPSVGADVVFCVIDGTRGVAAEGPVVADEITWWRLEGLGWASAQFLAVPTE